MKTTASPQPLSLGEFLYQKGFLAGINSDVTIMCFGQEYRLHKLILSRSSFFASLVSATWADNSDESSKSRKHEIDFRNDENVTRPSFELALARLYGHEDHAKEKAHITGLLAVASFLDMPDIVEYCVQEIVKSVGSNNIAALLNFSTRYEYGEASRTIMDSCKTYLFTEGYDLPREVWADIPNEVTAEVVAADGFYVPTEWDRVQFLVLLYRHKVNKILSTQTGKPSVRRLTRSQADDLQPLRDTLNFKIHYCHLTYTQLEMLENLRDHRGQLLIRRESLRNALWLQTGLRHKVMNASVDQEELGLARTFASKLRRKGKGKSKPKEDNDEDLPESSSTSPSSSVKAKSRAESLDEKEQGENDSNEGDEGDSSFASGEEEDPYESSDDEEGAFTYYPIPSEEDSLEHSFPKELNERSGLMTKFPPFRFSVKFDDVTKLKVDKRVYSKTYWYAGSYWNIYIQKVQYKKSHQLGVYLHRGKLEPNAHNNTLRLDQRLSLFDLSEDEPFSPRLLNPNNATVSPPQRRSQSLFSVDAHASGLFFANNPTRDAPDVGLEGPNWDLGLGNTSLLDAAAVPWTDPDAIDADTTDALASQANTTFADGSLGLGVNSTSPQRNARSSLGWSPPMHLSAALTATTIAPANPQGATSSATSTDIFGMTEAEGGNHTRQASLSGPNSSSATKKSVNAGVSKPEYLDARKGIQAYFEIYTPSRRRGSQLTCFSSSPDNFKFAQSWGWKSSSLCAAAEETLKNGRQRDESKGLKFMIVVGVV